MTYANQKTPGVYPSETAFADFFYCMAGTYFLLELASAVGHGPGPGVIFGGALGTFYSFAGPFVFLSTIVYEGALLTAGLLLLPSLLTGAGIAYSLQITNRELRLVMTGILLPVWTLYGGYLVGTMAKETGVEDSLEWVTPRSNELRFPSIR